MSLSAVQLSDAFNLYRAKKKVEESHLNKNG